MSDYLSRAASRAVPDPKPAIRPRLPSRYEDLAAAPTPVREQEMESFTAPAVAGLQPMVPPSALAHDAPPFPSQTFATVSSAPRVVGEPPASDIRPAAPVPPIRVSPVVETAAQPVPVEVHHHFASEKRPHPVPTVPPPAPLFSEQIIVPAAPASAEHPAHSEPPALPAAVEKPHPEPLLEAPQAALPPPATTVPSAEQRTVNITIGRLEIRAATSAPERPRPQAAPGRGPLSLDEFLGGKSPRRRARTSDS